MRVRYWAARAAAATTTTGLIALTITAASAQAATTAHHSAPPTLWVSASAPAVPGDGTSCSHPGFSTVQAAVSAAPSGANVKICTGSYPGQVEITKSLHLTGTGGPVKLTLPATPGYATACARTATSVYGVDVCGPVQVTLSSLTIDSSVPFACNDDFNALSVAGGATVEFANSAVTGAGSASSGCQGGIGILVTDGHLVALNSAVSGYQKNGITIKGANSSAFISEVAVTGVGATPFIAQNGIEIADGALGLISGSKVRGNECGDVAAGCGPDGLSDVQSTGVLFYNAAPGSQLSSSDLTGNDIGVYFLAPSAQHTGAVISRDKIHGNRYEDAVLDQGKASIDHSVLSGGNVALQLLQYSGQTAGINAAASHDVIGPAAVHAVQVYSDQASGDLPGKLVISDSTIKGSIANNSPAAARVAVIVH